MKLFRNHLYLPLGVCKYISLRHPDLTLADGVRMAMETWHSEPHGQMGEIRLPKAPHQHVEVNYHRRLSSPEVAAKVIWDAGNNGVII